jgi:hypothetical protein
VSDEKAEFQPYSSRIQTQLLEPQLERLGHPMSEIVIRQQIKLFQDRQSFWSKNISRPGCFDHVTKS